MMDGWLALIKFGAQQNDWLGFEEDLVWRIAPAGAVLDFVGNKSTRIPTTPSPPAWPASWTFTVRLYNRTTRTGEPGRL